MDDQTRQQAGKLSSQIIDKENKHVDNYLNTCRQRPPRSQGFSRWEWEGDESGTELLRKEAVPLLHGLNSSVTNWDREKQVEQISVLLVRF